MYALVLGWFFIFGAIIGSFLNVVIYRLHTGKSLSGRSHCLSCAERLHWYELVPIVSYCALRGRCRSCRARITVRYALVEIMTGALFAWIASSFLFDPVLLVLNLAIVSLLVVVLVYDLRHTIIPDELVLYLLAYAAAYVLWDPFARAIALPPLDALLGGLVPALFFGSIWFFSRGRAMGLGDAKLVLPLGMVVGFMGSFSLVACAFWIGALVGLVLVGVSALQRHAGIRRLARGKLRLPFLHTPLTMGSEVPFAPFLILAFLLVHLAGIDVLDVVGSLISFP